VSQSVAKIPELFHPGSVIENLDVSFIFRKDERVSQLLSHVLLGHLPAVGELRAGIIWAEPAVCDSMRFGTFLVAAAFMHESQTNRAAGAAAMNIPSSDIEIQIFFPSRAQRLSLVKFFIIVLEGFAGCTRISAGGQFHQLIIHLPPHFLYSRSHLPRLKQPGQLWRIDPEGCLVQNITLTI
jgi:hypothetical protein